MKLRQFKKQTKTSKLYCKAFIKYSFNLKMKKMVIVQMELNHNHDLEIDTYEKYPENRLIRKASPELICEIKSAMNLGSNIKKTLEHYQSTTARFDIPKSFYNLMTRYTPTDLTSFQILVEQLRHDQFNDKKMIIDFTVDENDELEMLFLQTSSMKQAFSLYADHILIDATYWLNYARMPLFIILAVDGNNISRIVALSLVRNESKVLIEHFIDTFLRYNTEPSNLRTIMVDKDQTLIDIVTFVKIMRTQLDEIELTTQIRIQKIKLLLS